MAGLTKYLSLRASLSATSLSALLLAFVPLAEASCGSAFCTLNTNWSAQGVWTEPGARLDLRYEYIDQDELRSGSGAASADEIADMHHREQYTQNRNLQTTFDYAFDERYGLSINAPLIARDHLHYHLDHVDPSALEAERWEFTQLGDLRVIGRMQLSPSSAIHAAYGINLGLKLPTGEFTVANGAGEQAERSLQPGTGTTDAIIGGYYHQQLPEHHSQWFAQFQLQKPLNARADFKAGEQWGADIGYLYPVTQALKLVAQLNYSHKGRDSGTQAEPEESGGKVLSLSPGVTYALNHSLQLYGFVHHRLYQYANGVQLSGSNSVVVGISTRF